MHKFVLLTNPFSLVHWKQCTDSIHLSRGDLVYPTKMHAIAIDFAMHARSKVYMYCSTSSLYVYVTVSVTVYIHCLVQYNTNDFVREKHGCLLSNWLHCQIMDMQMFFFQLLQDCQDDACTNFINFIHNIPVTYTTLYLTHIPLILCEMIFLYEHTDRKKCRHHTEKLVDWSWLVGLAGTCTCRGWIRQVRSD